jgi:hypothetical protein
MKIEIFDKKNGEVLETKELSERGLSGFITYFAMQCDTVRYGWREVKE